jgi:hypothetical protein
MSTNAAFYAVMIGCLALAAYGIYDRSPAEIGIAVGIALLAIVGTIYSDWKRKKDE